MTMKAGTVSGFVIDAAIKRRLAIYSATSGVSMSHIVEFALLDFMAQYSDDDPFNPLYKYVEDK